MGAFNPGGSSLSSLESDFLKNLAANYPAAGAPSDDFYSKYYPAAEHQKAPDYYSTPATGATPNTGYTLAPAPEGWDPSAPPPYPSPTTQQPPELINARWNPYTGKWEGAQLQPTNPPPSSGGGIHTF
jgi:hypothetical protein